MRRSRSQQPAKSRTRPVRAARGVSQQPVSVMEGQGLVPGVSLGVSPVLLPSLPRPPAVTASLVCPSAPAAADSGESGPEPEGPHPPGSPGSHFGISLARVSQPAPASDALREVLAPSLGLRPGGVVMAAHGLSPPRGVFGLEMSDGAAMGNVSPPSLGPQAGGGELAAHGLPSSHGAAGLMMPAPASTDPRPTIGAGVSPRSWVCAGQLVEPLPVAFPAGARRSSARSRARAGPACRRRSVARRGPAEAPRLPPARGVATASLGRRAVGSSGASPSFLLPSSQTPLPPASLGSISQHDMAAVVADVIGHLARAGYSLSQVPSGSSAQTGHGSLPGVQWGTSAITGGIGSMVEGTLSGMHSGVFPLTSTLGAQGSVAGGRSEGVGIFSTAMAEDDMPGPSSREAWRAHEGLASGAAMGECRMTGGDRRQEPVMAVPGSDAASARCEPVDAVGHLPSGGSPGGSAGNESPRPSVDLGLEAAWDLIRRSVAPIGLGRSCAGTVPGSWVIPLFIVPTVGPRRGLMARI
ncbi:uncharacterized protein LOC115084796 [Rhinatrema bivittatum]|uniref:uncharacterized protein LOC115084796 n=1 Tax=Rhinatrema bivittatum TaxID=194408 RepID=UPI0011295212|nr:uncharacterized protein LOC115084796 [Rhinatrema bivittatum]